MSGLNVFNNIIEYIERPLEITGSVRKTKGFKVAVDDIMVIGVRAKVLLDDEDFIVTLVDKHKNEYKFSSLEFETEAGKFLEEEFGISLKCLWGSFSYWEHERGKNRILYPKELQGKRLYKRMFESFEAFFKALNLFSSTFSAVLTDEVEVYIDQVNTKYER